MPPSSAKPVFSVVVPAYNEAENLAILVPKLIDALAPLADVEIIVVDNASTDNTKEMLETYAMATPPVRRVSEPTLGYGRAVLAGLAASRGSIIGIIRADNQEKPEDLARMLREAREDGRDLLYNAVRAHRINDGASRVAISFVFNTLFKIFFGLRSIDLNATPKVFTRPFLEKAALESKDWFIDSEMVIKAEKLGFPVRETEIEYLPRLKGKSSVRLRHIFEFLGNMLQWHSRIRHGRLLER